MNNKHLAFQIALGTIVEYVSIGIIAIKLLNKLFEWVIERLTPTMISIGIAGIILLGIVALWLDTKLSCDGEVDEDEE